MMKGRPRQERVLPPSKGRRISTVVVIVVFVSVLLISPDAPTVSEVRSSTSVIDSSRASEPVAALDALPQQPPAQPESDAEPLSAEVVVDRPASLQEVASDAAREEGDVVVKQEPLTEAVKEEADEEVVREEQTQQGTAPPLEDKTAEPPAGDAEQHMLSEPVENYVAPAGDYIKNEFTEGREASKLTEDVKQAEESKSAEEQKPVLVERNDGETPAERQEEDKSEVKNAPQVDAASGGAERAAAMEGDAPPPALEDASRSICLKHIVYDKPVKTGSTAVRKALMRYFDGRGEKYFDCSFASCTQTAKDVCADRMQKMNLMDHMVGDEDVVNCLGRMGYYKVTSVREPLERWESSFLYNRGKKTSHYGIPYEASYEEFMSKYPACSLFDYYDGLGKRCEMSPISLEERIRRIVERYDEIIDLYHDDVQGQLHKRLQEHLSEQNKSSRPDHDFRVTFDRTRLENETRLYNALRQRQKELLDREPELC